MSYESSKITLFFFFATLWFALLSVGCDSSIGDSCRIASDCSPYGDRICDSTSPGGYCTVAGCDWDTCPTDSVCVRFYSGSIENRSCTRETEDKQGGTNDCSPDEVCTIYGKCSPSAAESRYCMLSCDDGGDCRDNYECRNEGLMKVHGGEPVLGPMSTSSLPSFCAASPVE